MGKRSLMRPVGVLSALLLSAAVSASSSPIAIGKAWARATPPGATVAAAYLEVTSMAADRLLGASTPVAASVEMHGTVQENGMMRMRRQESLALAPGRTQTFAPGGLHLMLIGLRQPLAANAHFPIVLRFEKAGEIATEVAVVASDAAGLPH